jgi:hypothetical protein
LRSFTIDPRAATADPGCCGRARPETLSIGDASSETISFGEWNTAYIKDAAASKAFLNLYFDKAWSYMPARSTRQTRFVGWRIRRYFSSSLIAEKDLE